MNAVDHLRAKLARVRVDPYLRKEGGKVEHVEGYLRDQSLAETTDAILGAIKRTKERATKTQTKPVKGPKGEFFPKLPANAGAPMSERVDLRKYLAANDWKVYHGTSAANAKEILSKGLLSDKDLGNPQPSEDEAEGYDEPYLWDGVFLGNKNRASEFGEVLLEIDLKGTRVLDSLVEYYRDEDEDEEDSVHDILVAGSIPPSRIKVVS